MDWILKLEIPCTSKFAFPSGDEWQPLHPKESSSISSLSLIPCLPLASFRRRAAASAAPPTALNSERELKATTPLSPPIASFLSSPAASPPSGPPPLPAASHAKLRANAEAHRTVALAQLLPSDCPLPPPANPPPPSCLLACPSPPFLIPQSSSELPWTLNPDPTRKMYSVPRKMNNLGHQFFDQTCEHVDWLEYKLSGAANE